VKETPVIPVNKVVGPKRIIGKNVGPRRRRGTEVTDPNKPVAHFRFSETALAQPIVWNLARNP
jgi:hypothetical protein